MCRCLMSKFHVSFISDIGKAFYFFKSKLKSAKTRFSMAFAFLILFPVNKYLDWISHSYFYNKG